MAVMTTGHIPKGLIPGVKMWFQNTSEQVELECMQLLDRESSSRAWEEYASYVGFGLASVKPEADTFNYDEGKQGFVTRLTNFRTVTGFKVTYEMMKNGSWNPNAFKSARELAMSLDATKEYTFGLILSRAFNSGYLGADGIQLVSTAHVRKWDGSAYSNRLTTDQDLSETSIESMLVQMMSSENERGIIVPIVPKCLVVHPTDVFDAHRIYRSVLQNDTANNATNAIRAMGVFPDGIKTNRYFTYGNGAWFVRTNMHGLIYQEREGRKFGRDMADFDTENVSFKGADWWAMGWSNPYSIWGTSGAA